MIDLYTHLLLNVGQGPKSESVFTEMAKQLVEQGITTAVVSPYDEGIGKIYGQGIETYVQQANELLSSKFIPLHVIVAQEVMASSDTNHELMTVDKNPKYLYLRLSTQAFQCDIETLVYDLQLAGFIPVLLHPEKYPSFQENTNSLYKIAKQGAILLLDAQSFLGMNSRKTKKVAFQLLNHGLCHAISSSVTPSTYRKVSLAKVYNVISHQYGEALRDTLIENAQAIVSGYSISKDEPERIKKTKFLGIF
ncbi:CpsB/CapC family capsule biosynthesis tyrosine phosphatase [Priestia megaterium]|uniref:CpsB/CapC family capsule biosynthesis tyrosine phosphatase n=1 Tax=Priestia megaterium TaxID=1404 RepID=UPI0022B92F92|nr:CpsB/CapC family capsule biosynthesis tyrosine phosphatase [Priestia megaterium]MCZ8493382.1 tyrosine protein phosphatase [Priestia megaterium]